jgi:hypothetical protein
VTVLVPVERAVGVEYSVVSAASEAKAVAWLRSRSHVRWTMGRRGELEVSLQTADHGFRLESDVSAVSWAEAPARSCSCR